MAPRLRSPRPTTHRPDRQDRGRPWLAPALVIAATAAILAVEPTRAAIGRLMAGIHDGFVVVFLQAGSFVAGCF